MKRRCFLAAAFCSGVAMPWATASCSLVMGSSLTTRIMKGCPEATAQKNCTITSPLLVRRWIRFSMRRRAALRRWAAFPVLLPSQHLEDGAVRGGVHPRLDRGGPGDRRGGRRLAGDEFQEPVDLL